ncbi:hypothetical protein [Virgisporangium ochraceum]|uniref:Uncharacterized protein n=1 Tax=Virgisporangium ochraceum TaxID=65505 RepID=A0A8J3ZL10_9ACTN|nr:hypothetical protein [Virgisporangium ochraceum]GIJ66274.1 hypothetical protein Voc01_011910 [Virgisporangium ochraceum]
MTAPTRADLAHRALFWAAVAEEAKARATAARTQLDEQAKAEYAATGAASTWRVPGVGTIPLSLTQDAVVVDDEAVYLAHVAEAYPTEIETIRRVRPAFDELLRKSVLQEPRDVPGLRIVPGGRPKGISVRATTSAKESAARLARTFLDNSGGGA